MAALDAPRITISTGMADGVSRMAYLLVAKVSEWNDARLTRKALFALSDHELDDLGLCRGDIDDVARGKSRL